MEVSDKILIITIDFNMSWILWHYLKGQQYTSLWYVCSVKQIENYTWLITNGIASNIQLTNLMVHSLFFL